MMVNYHLLLPLRSLVERLIVRHWASSADSRGVMASAIVLGEHFHCVPQTILKAVSFVLLWAELGGGGNGCGAVWLLA